MLILTSPVPIVSFQAGYSQTQRSPLDHQQGQQTHFSPVSLSQSAPNANSDSILSPQASNKSFNSYTNPALGINLQFPSTWSVEEDPIMNQVTFIAPLNNNEWYLQQEYLQVSFIPSENLTLDEWMKETTYYNKTYYKQDSSSYPEVRLDATTSFGFNGHVDRTFWYSSFFDGVENKTRDTFFIDNDKLYRIRYGPYVNGSAISYYGQPNSEEFFRDFVSLEAKAILDSIVTIPPNEATPLQYGMNSSSREIQKLLLTKPNNTETEEHYYENPQIAISESGDIYAVWYGDNSSGDPHTWFTRITDGGLSVGEIVNLDVESNESGQDFPPQLAMSGDNLYVLWNGFYTPVYLKYSEDGGKSFTNNAITWGEDGDAEITNGKLLTHNNNVYILLYSLESSPHPMYLARSIDGGRNFEPLVNITSNETGGGESGDPQITLSDNGNIYVTWYDGEYNDVLFSRSVDSGASFSAPLQPLGNGSSCIGDYGRLLTMKLAASGDHVYLACHTVGAETFEGQAGMTYDEKYTSLMLARSIDGGGSFESPLEIATMYTIGSNDLNIVTEGNNTYMVWVDDGIPPESGTDLYFMKSTDAGATFGSPINLSFDKDESINPEMSVNGNVVAIAWQNETSFQDPEGSSHTNNEIFLITSTNGGNTFGNAVNISTDVEDSTEPDIVVQGNNIFTIWASEAEEPSQKNIWFARTNIS